MEQAPDGYFNFQSLDVCIIENLPLAKEGRKVFQIPKPFRQIWSHCLIAPFPKTSTSNFLGNIGSKVALGLVTLAEGAEQRIRLWSSQ